MTHTPDPPVAAPAAEAAIPANSAPGAPDQTSRQTSRLSFKAALSGRWAATDAFLCVGLDPLPDRLPKHLLGSGTGAIADAVWTFCTEIVAATGPVVCAFKPQIAHFAALGCESVLQDVIAHIHQKHPGIPVILDAKRGDIGSTAERYAIEAFERFDADAVTVNPWLGPEGLAPFLSYQDRGTIVLCRTSNADSAWLQINPEGDNQPYLRVARAARDWNTQGNVMLVAGATYPEELGDIRSAAGDDVGLLVPGIGAQGGDLASVFRQGASSDGFGLAVSSSRAVLYASGGEDYAAAAGAVAAGLVDEMRELRRSANFIRS